ncbi:transposase [Nocardia coubleae]|uniref:Transposase n=1 Tax=Nocardia coubleae TaxID=356147 RepID=A0A846VZ08_9NOCA|nr:transposase [Nocardia coubleae]
MLITARQARDCPMLPKVLDAIAVPRLAGGSPRRNPDRVSADKAYSSAANRELLRGKRIKMVIPQHPTKSPTGNAVGFAVDARRGLIRMRARAAM